MTLRPVTVVGGGLAGSEAAWQLGVRGVPVVLYEMRPERSPQAHCTGGLAELVCSNTFGSLRQGTAPGAFKAELECAASLVIRCARESFVPAGQALAVDRIQLSMKVEAELMALGCVELRREELKELPPADAGPVIVATGPLGSESIMEDLARRTGRQALAFYDAIAPIVDVDSLTPGVAYAADRWDRRERVEPGSEPETEPDYLNIPLNQEQYESFITALIEADTVPETELDSLRPFEGCMPIEVLARRGMDSLRYGPMRPVGLRDPDGNRPWAVLQLRRETASGSARNLVGFQTRLRYPEQRRVLGSLPGFSKAEWLRLGSVHRNSFVQAPEVLDPWLRLRAQPNLRVAGQLCGSEGYTESVAMGLWAALGVLGELRGVELEPPPVESMFGALLAYLRDCPPERFQPMNVNFGLVPRMENAPRSRKDRRAALGVRAVESFERWWSTLDRAMLDGWDSDPQKLQPRPAGEGE